MAVNETTLHREKLELPGRSQDQPFGPTSVLERYWIHVPARLRRYSITLSAAWADGMYLTAWRLGRLLPVVVFLLGLVEGATHLSFLTLGDGSMSASQPAVAFAQNLVLVLFAAAIGSLSANLGMTLLLGYAIGDYLLAGPQLTISSNAPLAGFLYLHVPQLVSYVLFFMLAVLPTLTSWHLLEDLRRRLPGKYSRSLAIGIAGTAVVQGVIVYAWTLAAPMVFRIFWTWLPGNGGSPVTVIYYQQITVPWVPAIAVAAIVARGWLEWRAFHDAKIVRRSQQIQALLIRSDGRPAFTRRLSPWLRAAALAVLFTVLTSGFFASPFVGAVMLFAFAVILVGQASILPRLLAWRACMAAMGRIPVVIRLGVAMVATYFLARLVFALSGNSSGLNTQAGQFGAQLVAIVLGLITAVALGAIKPVPEKIGSAAGNPPATRVRSTIAWQRVGQIALVLALLVMTPVYLHASCQDPTCCFGSPTAAGLGTSGLGSGLYMCGLITIVPPPDPPSMWDMFYAWFVDWFLTGTTDIWHNPVYHFDPETQNAVAGVRG